MDLYLPQKAIWYNYYTKQIHTATTKVTPEWIPDDQQGTFIRGGSILPILAHKRELSLLKAIKNDVKLDIYPDSHSYAIGILYLDDGESL